MTRNKILITFAVLAVLVGVLWALPSRTSSTEVDEGTATARPLPVRATSTTSTTTTTTTTAPPTTTTTTTTQPPATTVPAPATSTTVAPTPTTTAPPVSPVSASSSVPYWAHGVAGAEAVPPILWAIARCEGAMNPERWDPWTIYNFAGSSASGPWQIIRSTWAGHGGYVNAADAPPAVQVEKAMILYETRGTQPWAASKPCWR